MHITTHVTKITMSPSCPWKTLTKDTWISRTELQVAITRGFGLCIFGVKTAIHRRVSLFGRSIHRSIWSVEKSANFTGHFMLAFVHFGFAAQIFWARTLHEQETCVGALTDGLWERWLYQRPAVLWYSNLEPTVVEFLWAKSTTWVV